MLNDDYEPTGSEEAIIDVLQEKRRMQSKELEAQLDIERSTLSTHLHRLAAANWITKPPGSYGMYEFNLDPREASDEELARLYLDHVTDLVGRETAIQYLGEADA